MLRLDIIQISFVSTVQVVHNALHMQYTMYTTSCSNAQIRTEDDRWPLCAAFIAAPLVGYQQGLNLQVGKSLPLFVSPDDIPLVRPNLLPEAL